MQYDALFLLVAGVLSIFLLVIRTNIALAIFGLCAGYVISDILSTDLSGYLYDNGYNSGNLPLSSIVAITLIVAPALLIILRFRHSQKNRFVYHLVPIFSFLCLLGVLVLNNLPISYSDTLLSQSEIFRYLDKYQIFIITAVVGLSILDIMLFEYQRGRQMAKLGKKAKKRHK